MRKKLILSDLNVHSFKTTVDLKAGEENDKVSNVICRSDLTTYGSTKDYIPNCSGADCDTQIKFTICIRPN